MPHQVIRRIPHRFLHRLTRDKFQVTIRQLKRLPVDTARHQRLVHIAPGTGTNTEEVSGRVQSRLVFVQLADAFVVLVEEGSYLLQVLLRLYQ